MHSAASMQDVCLEIRETRATSSADEFGGRCKTFEQATRFQKKAPVIKWGLALVPVIGPAYAQLMDSSGPLLFLLNTDEIVAYLTGNFSAFAQRLLDFGSNGCRQQADVELTVLEYS